MFMIIYAFIIYEFIAIQLFTIIHNAFIIYPVIYSLVIYCIFQSYY